jgi:hypothetical protein
MTAIDQLSLNGHDPRRRRGPDGPGPGPGVDELDPETTRNHGENAGQSDTGNVAGSQRVAPLRGASVAADSRRILRAVGAAGLVVMVVLVTVLFVSGVRKNAQIDALRQRGVPVAFTVSGCTGLLGGSGSNAAGYTCRGTFVLDGRRYRERIPGDTLYRPGTTLSAVTVPGDPALLATTTALASERASARVFILPTVLLVATTATAGAVVVRTRRRAPG